MPIEIENLTYKYMRKTPLEKIALNNINLRIEDGQFIGLIGKTGSGKSTLIQHLNGLLKPLSGRVMIDGLDTMGKELKELRKKVGLVFQFPEYQLFEETVFKDIAFGVLKSGLSEHEIKERVFEAAKLVGLDENALNKSPFELSGGQKRRAAIAGVIVMRTKYLVMDEPGSGLDPAGRNGVLSLVSKLNKNYGTTVIIASHNMSDIAKYSDRVLVMDKGEIVIDGTPETVFSKVDELESVGLRTLDFQYLLKKLKTRIPDIDNRVVNVRQAADVVAEIIAPTGGVCGNTSVAPAPQTASAPTVPVVQTAPAPTTPQTEFVAQKAPTAIARTALIAPTAPAAPAPTLCEPECGRAAP